MTSGRFGIIIDAERSAAKVWTVKEKSMSQIPKPHEIYRHFKGSLYQITAIAQHSETGEMLVIYQALYGDFKIYARPLAMFMEKLDQEKYPGAGQEYRFELQGGTPDTGRAGEAAAGDTEPADTVKAGGTKPADAETTGIQTGEIGREGEEELHIDPLVMEFLEADTYEERLNIMVGLHHRITHEMINTMAVASDVEVPEGELEERYEGLKNCLLTLQKYECTRLR